MSRPLRIALVLHGWPAARMGGTGMYVGVLSQALQDLGHEVAVVVPGRRPGVHSSPEDGIGVVRIGALPSRLWRHGHRHGVREHLWEDWLAAWRPDLVHLHHLSGLSLRFPELARRAGVGVVLTLHDYAIPCARGQLVDDRLQPCVGPRADRCARCLAPFLSSSLSRSPVRRGATAGTGPSGSPPASGSLPASQVRLVADRLVDARAALGAADRVLAPSAHLAAWFSGFSAVRPERCELPLIQPIPAAPEPEPGPVRFLFASSIIPTKGPQYLVEAFAGLPDGVAQLSVAGHTPDFAGWPGFARDLQARVAGLVGARWLGPLEPARIPAVMARHDVLVLPSLWPENSPLVVREATAAGLRVIVSTEGGAGELAPDARQVAPGDVPGLKNALQAEVGLGRGRVSPQRWPTAQTHAAALVAQVYRPVLAVRTNRSACGVESS